MEKADNVAVVPVEMGWNDVGTWGALHEIFPRDDQGNVILGRVLDRGSRAAPSSPRTVWWPPSAWRTSSWWIPRTPPWYATGTGSRK